MSSVKKKYAKHRQTGLKELFSKLRFVLIALLVYRLGVHIPVPGVDPERLSQLFAQNQGPILNLFNMFSGGALERMSIFALGIIPYISASIIIQMLTAVVPSLEALKKEGEHGKMQISQYTRYLTVILAVVQSLGISAGLVSQDIVFNDNLVFYFISIVSFVSGTVFLMWLGEQITEKGVGNGISLLIFASIVSGLPLAIGHAIEKIRIGDMGLIVLPFFSLLPSSSILSLILHH